MDIPEAGAATPEAGVLTLTTVAATPAVGGTRVAGVILAVDTLAGAPWAGAGSDSPGAAAGADDAALAAWAAKAGD